MFFTFSLTPKFSYIILFMPFHHQITRTTTQAEFDLIYSSKLLFFINLKIFIVTINSPKIFNGNSNPFIFYHKQKH